MKADKFIGSEIETGKGILTVKESYVDSNKRKRYIVECSICSKDSELFPYGSINAPKYNLIHGNIPCGCATLPKWSHDQWVVRVEREVKNRGYELLGWKGDKLQDSTRLVLYNSFTDNKWDSSTAGKFLSGQGDPKHPHYLKNRKPDEYYIEMFLATGAYPEGTVFKRNNSIKDKLQCYSYWDVSCPVCKNDLYSRAGFPYTFTCSNASLRTGSRPCRCYKGYCFSKAEREFLIDKICKEENHIFKGFDDDWQGQFTKFSWECKHGHKNSTNIDNFLNGVRCPRCYHNIPRCKNGYYSTRIKELDNLYLIEFKKDYETFLKVGRTFEATRYPRSDELKRLFSADSYKILLNIQGNHEDIWNLECKVLDKYRGDYRYYFDKPVKGHTECLIPSIKEVLIEDLISMSDNRFKITYKEETNE